VDEALVWSDGLEQAAAIRNGKVSASELLDAYLERIDRYDGALNSFVTVDRDGARDAARAADEAVAAGRDDLAPFHGVVLSVKDMVDVAGLRTTNSCRALADYVPAEDALVVRRFREAGFVILGKTNVPEFGTSMTDSALNGLCRNPWNQELTPGGSSGGAAAAQAAALCGVAHGTDGGGSVRVPAAFCGLVGLKPSRATGFDIEESSPFYSTSVSGSLTRSVRDAAAMADVLAGAAVGLGAPEAPRPGSHLDAIGQAPESLRLAVSTTAPMGETSDECAAAAESVAATLASFGHQVVERTPDWVKILTAQMGVGAPGVARFVRPDQIDLVEPRNRSAVLAAPEAKLVDHAQWVEQLRTAARRFLAFWDDVDVLVTPTAGIVAPSVTYAPWNQSFEEHRQTFGSFPSFAQPFNLSGQPGISVPAAWSSAGLPIGIQLVGRRNEERTLLRLAAQLEEALPWAERRPLDLPAA
jgi:amidase